MFKINDKFFYLDGTIKIMAIADKYAMVRRPRCMPFVMYFDDLEKLKMVKNVQR